ncbi:MAG: L-histidine N(alpha)-methyltransferase [Bacteriovoracaceae bacterium]
MKEHQDLMNTEFNTLRFSMLKEVLVGLSKNQKSIHPKFLYDKVGSEIFDKITSLKEYYITRAEREILKRHARDISRLVGPESLIIEPGSGSGDKIRSILPYLIGPAGYIPLEISHETLSLMSQKLKNDFPKLEIFPVCADFTTDFELPMQFKKTVRKKVVFFPGSTIGNFDPDEACQFLKKTAQIVESGGGLLIGVDMKNDSEHLLKAYDDSEGVTASFNLNLLRRLNDELGSDFDLENFSHLAILNSELGRVEMHLKSQKDQMVKVNQTVFRIKEGETIHTENSYKYSVGEFVELCGSVKFKLVKYWQDSKNLFTVYYFERI